MDRLTPWLTSNFRWLKSQLMRGGRTREDAEDLIQEAYLRVYAYCARREAREPEKVLVRTVMRLSQNDRRDRSRHPCVGEPIEELHLIDPAPQPEDVFAAQVALGKVIKTLQEIEPRSREAFLLHRVDGLTYAQISRQMGVSVSAVEKHIAWAVAVLLDAAGDRGTRE